MVQDVLKRELMIESPLRQVGSGVWYKEAQRGNSELSITGFGVTIPHVADYGANTFKPGVATTEMVSQSGIRCYRGGDGSGGGARETQSAYAAGHRDPGLGRPHGHLRQ